jgi:hypothetical protein
MKLQKISPKNIFSKCFFKLFYQNVFSKCFFFFLRCTREDKQWKGKKLAIEDPFSTKRSLTRSVNSLRVLEFISDCFNIAYLYFGTVQTTLGPIVTRIIVDPKEPTKLEDSSMTSDMADILDKLKLDEHVSLILNFYPCWRAMPRGPVYFLADFGPF